MTAKTYPPAGGASRYPEAVEHHVITYRASGHWYSPVPGKPWASYQHPVSCTHRHATPQAAQECGQLLSERAAAAHQANAQRFYPAIGCQIMVGTEPRTYDGQPGYLLYCAAHHTVADDVWQHTIADATASAWVCPWREHLTAGALASSVDVRDDPDSMAAQASADDCAVCVPGQCPGSDCPGSRR